MLTLHSYWRGLSESDRIKFCEKAEVTYGYMETHLIHARKNQEWKQSKMVEASNQKLTHKSLFDFFLGTSKTA